MQILISYMPVSKITFFRPFCARKYHPNSCHNSGTFKQSQSLFLKEKITFKYIESETKIGELLKKRTDLRTVINLIDWSHISPKYTESKNKAIKRLEEVQNFEFHN